MDNPKNIHKRQAIKSVKLFSTTYWFFFYSSQDFYQKAQEFVESFPHFPIKAKENLKWCEKWFIIYHLGQKNVCSFLLSDGFSSRDSGNDFKRKRAKEDFEKEEMTFFFKEMEFFRLICAQLCEYQFFMFE